MDATSLVLIHLLSYIHVNARELPQSFQVPRDRRLTTQRIHRFFDPMPREWIGNISVYVHSTETAVLRARACCVNPFGMSCFLWRSLLAYMYA